MMDGTLTLITPPDVFENESYSIMFMHLSDADQETVSRWLANSDIKENVNIYFYAGENDLLWFFHALARAEYRYIDLDSVNKITTTLSGYILGKKNTFYKTGDENLSAVCHYINQNRITNIESFLQRSLNDKN
jgi:predicted nucleotidyltransferase